MSNGYVKNYFKYYSKNEVEIVEEWMLSLNIPKEAFSVSRANTGFHDIQVNYRNYVFLVEVKTDEPYWYNRTGNIGLDYISSFVYTNNHFTNWIEIDQLEDFKRSIRVDKWGKLFTCDALIQVYYVEGKLLIGYDNAKLQDESFVDYLENNYRLRVNDKKAYNIADSWQSAAYFVNPLLDEELIDCQINSEEDLMRCISNN